MTKNIGIFLYNGAVVLDYAGPFEVFYNAKRYLDEGEIDIFTVAENFNRINTKSLLIYPEYAIANCPRIDILVIPGGTISNVTDNLTVMDWFQNIFPTIEKLVTICNGIMILPNLTTANGLTVTTHNYYLGEIKNLSPNLIVDKNKRFTDNGKILTSAGISAGIDLSLYLVEQIWGVKIAAKAAKIMEYDWKRSDSNFNPQFLDSLIEAG